MSKSKTPFNQLQIKERKVLGYFTWGPEHGLEMYNTEEEMLQELKAILGDYLDYDGFWHDEAGRVCGGKLEVTHKAVETDVKFRPSQEELDETGCDAEGNDWFDPDITKKVNYKIEQVTDTEDEEEEHYE